MPEQYFGKYCLAKELQIWKYGTNRTRECKRSSQKKEIYGAGRTPSESSNTPDQSVN